MRKYLIGLAALGFALLCASAWAAWTSTTTSPASGSIAPTWLGGEVVISTPTITEQGPSPSCSSVTDVPADERPKPEDVTAEDPCWLVEDDSDGRRVVVPKPQHEEVVPKPE